MNRIIGDRIGAVLSAKDEEKIVHFLGYGKYVGEHHPPKEITNSFGISVLRFTALNPKLILDNGDVIWGCECWWAKEEIIQKYIKELTANGWTLVNVRISDYRRPEDPQVAEKWHQSQKQVK